uniref:CUB domain-containing protein n=1 Tax=Heterorhabditis bacteriophora TaxID=37862 RepID=A0A1I7X8Z9_HETBA
MYWEWLEFIPLKMFGGHNYCCASYNNNIIFIEFDVNGFTGDYDITTCLEEYLGMGLSRLCGIMSLSAGSDPGSVVFDSECEFDFTEVVIDSVPPS